MDVGRQWMFAAALGAVLGAAFAQTDAPQSAAAGTAAVPHVSGGVGEAEQARMQAAKDQYNLRLTFAVVPSGEYLSDVQVRIVDRAGRTVLETVSKGPLLYARLPPGDYTVTARAPEHDKPQSQTVQLPPQGARAVTLRFAR